MSVIVPKAAAASGTSHIAHKNVDRHLFSRLVIPGVMGGVLGAYVLTQLDPKLGPKRKRPKAVFTAPGLPAASDVTLWRHPLMLVRPARRYT